MTTASGSIAAVLGLLLIVLPVRWFLAVTIAVPAGSRARMRGAAMAGTALAIFVGFGGVLDACSAEIGMGSLVLKTTAFLAFMVVFVVCGGFFLLGTVRLLGRVHKPIGMADEEIRKFHAAKN